MDKRLEDRIKEIKKLKLDIFNTYKFSIPILAKPMSRPKLNNRGKFSRIYVPNAQENKKDIRQHIILPNDFKLITTPIKIKIVFYLPYYYGVSNIDKELAEKGYIHHIFKPDIDNLIKTILDAFNGYIWEDDCLVFKILAEKKLTEKENCHIDVIIKYQNGFISKLQKRLITNRKGNSKNE